MKNIIKTIIVSAVAATAIAATSIATFAAGISTDEAKQIALDNARLMDTDVTFTKEDKEMDDGILKYNIEFFSGNTEYEYEIDATTGAILSFDQENENFIVPKLFAEPFQKANSSVITREEALEIALSHAGYEKEDTLYTEVTKDFDDNKEIYDVEFRVGFVEYNYEINVANGKIIDFDIDD